MIRSAGFVLSVVCCLGVTVGCTRIAVVRVATDGVAAPAWHYWLNPLNVCERLSHASALEPATSAAGIRYYLPKPYLLVQPDNNGGVTSDVVFWPDPTQEYAADASVYLASQDFTMNITDGLLTSVTYNPKSDAVLGEAAKAAGSVSAEAFKRQDKDAETAKKDEETLRDDVAEARKAVVDAEAALEKAQFDLETAKKSYDRYVARYPKWADDPDKAAEVDGLADAVDKAKFAVKAATEDVERAKLNLRRVRGGGKPSPAFGGGGGGGAPAPATPMVSTRLVPGAMLFEIVDELDAQGVNNVSLRPVGWSVSGGGAQPQVDVETYRRATAAQGTGLTPVYVPGGPLAKMGDFYAAAIAFDTPLVDPVIVTVRNVAGAEVSLSKKATGGPESYFSTDGVKVDVVLSAKTFTPGRYEIHVAMPKDGVASGPIIVKLE